MKFSNFLETDKREGGLLTFFPLKRWGGGWGGSLESGALIEDLRYFTPMYTLCHIPVVRVQKGTCNFIITNLICTST